MSKIECPSGMTGEIRPLTVRDGKFLTNRKLQRDGLTLDRILDACWIETHSCDLYGFDDRPNWKKVLTGDRDFILVQVRIATHGPDYDLRRLKCRDCGERFDWTIDLGELEIQPLSEKSAETFKKSNRFDAAVRGTAYQFKLTTGEDALRQQQRQKKLAMQSKTQRKKDGDEEPNIMLDALEMRVVSIADEMDAKKNRETFEDMSQGEMRDLMIAFDKSDCGVETAIEIECPHCDFIWGMDLPFDQDFLFPSMRK